MTGDQMAQERAELEQVFADLYDPVVRLLVTRTGDQDVAAELARKVFVQAGETVGERPPGQTDIAWVWGITHSVHRAFLQERPETGR